MECTTKNRAQTFDAADPHQTLGAQVICFSKSRQMHDIVIGLFVNRYAFGRPV
jgi:hypothetical protein